MAFSHTRENCLKIVWLCTPYVRFAFLGICKWPSLVRVKKQWKMHPTSRSRRNMVFSEPDSSEVAIFCVDVVDQGVHNTPSDCCPRLTMVTSYSSEAVAAYTYVDESPMTSGTRRCAPKVDQQPTCRKGDDQAGSRTECRRTCLPSRMSYACHPQRLR